MQRITPGNEKEFRYFQEWLTARAALDCVVAATEPEADGGWWGPYAATDMPLSRLFDSVKNGASTRARSHFPDERPAWAPGGSPCGQTST
jgi:hypothetical protein